MSKSETSAKVFAAYLYVLGTVLVFAPNLLLTILGVATTSEVWIRVLGLLVFNLGVYVWVAARHRPFLEASVYTRLLVFAGLASFALLGMASPILALFGVVDLLGGLWTWLALRADASQGAAPHAVRI
ncbi:MAG: hypothetical protein ACLGI6_13490 [Gammaproteobacteria bacterium]